MSAFQSSSSQQGGIYERRVVEQLRLNGFRVEAEHRLFASVGVNVDIVAATPTGVVFVGECKATLIEGKQRPGLRRTDSVKKAIADAWAMSLHVPRYPYVLFTNVEPDAGSGLTMLDLARERGLVAAVVNVDRYGDIRRLWEQLEVAA